MKFAITLTRENIGDFKDDNNKKKYYELLSDELMKMKASKTYIENDKVYFRNNLFGFRSNFHPMTLIGKGYIYIDTSTIIYHYSVSRLIISWLIFSSIVFFTNLEDKLFSLYVSGVAFIIISIVTFACNNFLKRIIKKSLNILTPLNSR